MTISASDPELAALRRAWWPAWQVWRAHRSTDPPGVYEGEYVASRMDEDAGPYRTIMCPSAAELDAALREQRDLAGRAPS